MATGFVIPPSVYTWLIPTALGIKEIDQMASAGTFPQIIDLYPSVVFAIAFGIMRSILYNILFKVRQPVFYLFFV
jgi:hypothetical protein